MFVGKEVLGYTPVDAERKTMLDYTADNLNERDIPFYMIESVNQLQYNQQDGMYDLAGLVHYRTARVYAMAKEELEKITPEEAAMRFYISDLERNARVNLYPLYKKPLHGMNLTQTNLSYVKLVSQKLTDRGYTWAGLPLCRLIIRTACSWPLRQRQPLAASSSSSTCSFLCRTARTIFSWPWVLSARSSARLSPKGPCSSRSGLSAALRLRRQQPSSWRWTTGKRGRSPRNSAMAASSATVRLACSSPSSSL